MHSMSTHLAEPLQSCKINKILKLITKHDHNDILEYTYISPKDKLKLMMVLDPISRNFNLINSETSRKRKSGNKQIS